MTKDERPYVVIWYYYTKDLEQVSKYARELPDRIGDRHWKILLHDHGKKDPCNTHCDVLERQYAAHGE